jgi:N-methylhydantoinase A/oxoprolinase/acetone carboxylase beta subunit
MAHFALGIDTGGTFTDGVVCDLDQNTIITKTKVITTRNNLTIAINACLDNLLVDLDQKHVKNNVLQDLKMVSLSTTLATNGIVEGQGAEVGLILIGFDIEKELPTPHYYTIPGGCDIKGQIKEPLDLEAAKQAINNMKGTVEAFAISGYMSIRNPEQELAVEKLVRELTGYPVVCGHQLSGDLGIYERTVTAILNARLIPLIAHLVEAVKEGLHTRNITAPLRVVKGDGSVISEQVAMERPIETILSGPAASFIGARALSDIQDGVVVDMGGTTTDIAVLIRGRPTINDEGAQIGGWLTRVKAAEITTIGLGGDSIIRVSKDGAITTGPQKVFPLSWISAEYPYLLAELKNIEAARFFPLHAQPTCILCYINEPANIASKTEEQLLELIREEPHSLYYVSQKLKKDANILPWQRLVDVGTIHRANLTPTDILHVVGKFQRWSMEAAEVGVKIMATKSGTRVEEFIERVQNEVYYKLFSLIIEKLVFHKSGKMTLQKAEESIYFMKEMFYHDETQRQEIDFSVQVNIPVVAVGAPVNAYFPEIAQKLHVHLIMPEDADVANAIGTVHGKVIERVRVLIKPGESGGFFVYTPSGRKMFMNLEESIRYGETIGKEQAYKQAVNSGATDIEIIAERDDRYSSLSRQPSLHDENKLFIESRIDILAIGKPWEE